MYYLPCTFRVRKSMYLFVSGESAYGKIAQCFNLT